MGFTFAGYTDTQLQRIEDQASYEDLKAAWLEVFGAYDLQALNQAARDRLQRHLALRHTRRVGIAGRAGAELPEPVAGRDREYFARRNPTPLSQLAAE